MRRRLAWSVYLPLVLLSVLIGHELGYRLALGDAQERARRLAADGHGYLPDATSLFGFAAALVLLGLGYEIWTRLHTRSSVARPRLRVAALPVLIYLLQETIERLLGESHVHGLVTERAFLYGLALQLPLALAALVLGHLLQTVASAVAARLRPALPTVHSRFVIRSFEPVALPRLRPLAHSRSSRGPPALACR